MAQGKVDFFNDTGGYGFISTDDSEEDVFFHMEDIGGPDIQEGEEIEFEIEQAEKGPRATNVVRQ
jgi:CspA family cold shock protein